MMQTQIKYIASSGNTYDLTTKDILTRVGDYYDWSWKPEGAKRQYGSRVSSFSRDAAQYEPELIFGRNQKGLRKLIQALHNDFENDLRRLKPGRIVWGDWYLDCFINASKVDNISYWKWISNQIQVYAPYPFWIKEEKVVLDSAASAGQTPTSGEFLDYPYDYEYDYTASVIGEKNVYSESPFTSEFRLVIYGEAVNPRIVINGYPYVLYTTIPSGAYVIVDSREKTITMYQNGQRTNIFDFRNKSDSIFEKIPAGNLHIVWDSAFGADLTIFREQSEPEFEEVPYE